MVSGGSSAVCAVLPWTAGGIPENCNDPNNKKLTGGKLWKIKT